MLHEDVGRGGPDGAAGTRAVKAGERLLGLSGGGWWGKKVEAEAIPLAYNCPERVCGACPERERGGGPALGAGGLSSVCFFMIFMNV